MHNKGSRLKIFVSLSLLFTAWQAQAQNSDSLNESLYSISRGNSISKHFARLYYSSSLAADTYANSKPGAAAAFLHRFKDSFVIYFLDAAARREQGLAQTYSWQRYYSDTGLNHFQYYLLGMNAHINGDMWQALARAHSYDSIKKYRRVLLAFQKPLAIQFDSVYHSLGKNKKLKRLHLLTLGADRWYGKKLLRRWRVNQIKLALLYYSNPGKFRRRLVKTTRYKERLDNVMLALFRSR